jgi:hypothetical protein
LLAILDYYQLTFLDTRVRMGGKLRLGSKEMIGSRLKAGIYCKEHFGRLNENVAGYGRIYNSALSGW